MTAKSVLALDTESDRVVHIERVPEGYRSCICVECKKMVIAANRVSSHRKVAFYFRHNGSSGCGVESALHRYAKELIMSKMSLKLPDYATTVTMTDALGYRHKECFSVSGVRERFTSVRDEVPIHIGSNTIVADIVASTDEISILIEILVTHKVDDSKRNLLAKSRLDAMEIDLSKILEKDSFDQLEIDSYIMELADRQWLSLHRYSEQEDAIKNSLKLRIENHGVGTSASILAKKLIELKGDERSDYVREIQQRGIEAKKATQIQLAKKSADAWRREHSVLIAQLELLAKAEYRKAVADSYRARFRDVKSEEGMIYQDYRIDLGRVPNIVNIPVYGELAFDSHRIVWQTAIFRDIVIPAHNRELEHTVRKKVSSQLTSPYYIATFTARHTYDILRTRNIRVSRVVKLSEQAAYSSLEGDMGRLKLSYLDDIEYRDTPKPIETIRSYFDALCDIGVLEKAGDTYRSLSGRAPSMTSDVQNYKELVENGLSYYRDDEYG